MGCGAVSKESKYVTKIDEGGPGPKEKNTLTSEANAQESTVKEKKNDEEEVSAEKCMRTVEKLSSTSLELFNRVSNEVLRMNGELLKIRHREEVKNMERRLSGKEVFLEVSGQKCIVRGTVVNSSEDVTITAVNDKGEDSEHKWNEVSTTLGGPTLKDEVMATAKDKARKLCPAYAIEPSSADDEKKLLEVAVGERVDIVYRHHTGWTHCRKDNGLEGWVPQAHLEERAVLKEDIKSTAEGGSQLSGKAGEMVRVKLRHYSGWSLCFSPESGKEGWVADHQLIDSSVPEEATEDSEGLFYVLTIKRYGQVLEALQRVIESCEKAKGSFKWMQANTKHLEICADLKNDGIHTALQTLVEFLSDEVVAITEVLFAIETVNVRAAVKWLWDKQEGSLSVEVDSIVEVITRNVADSGWSWARYRGEEGWVPDAALDYRDAESEGSKETGRSKDVISARDENAEETTKRRRSSKRRKSHDVPRHDMKDLPKWVAEKSACWWWSESQKQYLAVTITSVKEETQVITVHFALTPTSWKAVRFDDVMGDNAASCNLQPPQDTDVTDEEDNPMNAIEDVADAMKELLGGDVGDDSTLLPGDFSDDSDAFSSSHSSDSSKDKDESSSNSCSIISAESRSAVVKFETSSRPTTPFTLVSDKLPVSSDSPASEEAIDRQTPAALARPETQMDKGEVARTATATDRSTGDGALSEELEKNAPGANLPANPGDGEVKKDSPAREEAGTSAVTTEGSVKTVAASPVSLAVGLKASDLSSPVVASVASEPPSLSFSPKATKTHEPVPAIDGFNPTASTSDAPLVEEPPSKLQQLSEQPPSEQLPPLEQPPPSEQKLLEQQLPEHELLQELPAEEQLLSEEQHEQPLPEREELPPERHPAPEVPEQPMSEHQLPEQPPPKQNLPEQPMSEDQQLPEQAPSEQELPEQPMSEKQQLPEQPPSEQELPKQPMSEQQLPEQPLSEQELPEQPAPKQQLPEQPPSEQELPEQPAPKQQLPEQPSPKQDLPEQPMSEEQLPEQPPSEQELPEQPMSEQQLPEQPLSEQERPEQLAPKQQQSEQPMSEQQMSEQQKPKQELPEEPVPQQQLPEQPPPEQELPKQPMPEQQLSEQQPPKQGLPEQPAPKQQLPEQPPPEQELPKQPMPEQQLSEQQPPKQELPEQPALKQGLPEQPAPKQQLPEQPPPEQQLPKQPMPEQQLSEQQPPKLPEQPTLKQQLPEQLPPEQELPKQPMPEQQLSEQQPPKQQLPEQPSPEQELPEQPASEPGSPMLTADALMRPTEDSQFAKRQDQADLLEYERIFVEPVEQREKHRACTRIQARARGIAGRRTADHMRRQRCACKSIGSAIRTFACQQACLMLRDASMATRIQSRQRAIMARKRADIARQQREDAKLEQIFQQLSQASPALALIEKLETLEEKRQNTREDSKIVSSRRRVFRACSAANLEEEAQYDEAFDMKLRALQEDLNMQEKTRKQFLDETLATRTEVANAVKRDTRDFVAWHEHEVAVCKREYPALFDLQKEELLQRKGRLKAQFQLSLALQSGSEEQVESARAVILSSSSMCLSAERVGALSCEAGLAEVAALARMLPEETQWLRTQEERHARNKLSLDHLRSLLVALEHRLEAERVWVVDSEKTAEEQGWDADLVVAQMRQNDRIARGQFIAQQNFAKERKIDKDMEGIVERSVQGSKVEVEHACEHVGARLQRAFGARAERLINVLTPLSENVSAINEEYDATVEAKQAELGSEVAKMEEEKKKKHELNRHMHEAALTLMIEKRRVENAKKPSGRYKKKPLKRALRNVKKLKKKLKDLDLEGSESKAKASVFLHSMRMIESQLRKELGDTSDTVPDGEESDEGENDGVLDTAAILKKKNEWEKTELTFQKKLESERERMLATSSAAFVKAAMLAKCRKQKEVMDAFAPLIEEATRLFTRYEKEKARLLDGIRLYPIAALVYSALDVERQRLAARRAKSLSLGNFGLPLALKTVCDLQTKVTETALADLPFQAPVLEKLIYRLQQQCDAGETMISELRVGAESIADYEEKEEENTADSTAGCEQKQNAPKAAPAAPPVTSKAPPRKVPLKPQPKTKPVGAERSKMPDSKRRMSTEPPRKLSRAGSNTFELLSELDSKISTLDNLMKKPGGMGAAKHVMQGAPPPKSVPPKK